MLEIEISNQTLIYFLLVVVGCGLRRCMVASIKFVWVGYTEKRLKSLRSMCRYKMMTVGKDIFKLSQAAIESFSSISTRRRSDVVVTSATSQRRQIDVGCLLLFFVILTVLTRAFICDGYIFNWSSKDALLKMQSTSDVKLTI